jgi:hypothetical protein
MLNRIGSKRYAVNYHWVSKRHWAPVANWKAVEQIRCFPRRVDRALGAFHQAPGVIGMRVGEDDRGRRNGGQLTEPIRSAIDHDAGVIVPNEQRAVTPVAP